MMISTVHCMLMILLICFRSKRMETIEKKLQENLNKIEQWAFQNSFQFLITQGMFVKHEHAPGEGESHRSFFV